MISRSSFVQRCDGSGTAGVERDDLLLHNLRLQSAKQAQGVDNIVLRGADRFHRLGEIRSSDQELRLCEGARGRAQGSP